MSRLSRAASLPAALSMRADLPSTLEESERSKKELVVDNKFIIDFVGELFPDAFTDEELPELLGRFSHDRAGHVPLSSLRKAIDDVIYEAELPGGNGALSRQASHRGKDAKYQGATAAMQIRQQARHAFQPDQKKKDGKKEADKPKDSKVTWLKRADTRTSLVECRTGFMESSAIGACTPRKSKDPSIGAAPEQPELLDMSNSEMRSRIRSQLIEDIGQRRLATWQMLYCGGSQPVVDALENIKKKFEISLKVEKFDW